MKLGFVSALLANFKVILYNIIIFAIGLNEPETPRFLPDGNWLIVEIQPPGEVMRI